MGFSLRAVRSGDFYGHRPKLIATDFQHFVNKIKANGISPCAKIVKSGFSDSRFHDELPDSLPGSLQMRFNDLFAFHGTIMLKNAF